MPDTLLRALDLEVRRRIDGLLQGEFQSSTYGPGMELAQVRRYELGDDVRQIEWNVTARTGEPHVRVHLAERNLTTWILLDSSPSMAFGTADRRKADVAEGVALAAGHVASARGNHLRTIAFGSPARARIVPRPGKVGMLGALWELRDADVLEGSGRTSLADALHLVATAAGPRGAVFIVSDLRGERDWRKALMRVAYRHDVVAVEIRDPREQELADVGDVWLVDPETGRQVRVDTRDVLLRRRFSEAATAEREELRRAVRSTGSDHVVLSTSGDWLRSLAGFISSRRRFR
ncbi:MAG: DUF58 domain-containing protein [Actinomycetota bacterium]